MTGPQTREGRVLTCASMHPSLRMVAVGLVAAVFGACFDFDATMAGGPSGDSGASDASLTDGAHDAPADATSEAATDGGVVETGPVEGGGGDSGTPEAGPFCSSQLRPDGGLFFCDDFDEAPLPGSWNSFGETSGTLAESDASAVSKPNSLDETTVPLADGGVINVALRTPLGVPALPATLRFEFSLEPVRIDTTASAAIVLGAIDFLDAAGDRYSLGLAINVASGMPALALGEQSALLDGGPTFLNHPLPPTQPLPMNAWTDIVLQVAWTAPTTGQATVTVGGTQELDVPLTMTVQATSLQIGVGTSFVTEPAPVWELRYDNVVFTAK